MRLLINIPKEFEQNFQADGFEDSLRRLSADAHLLAGNYEQETAVMLIEAFASAVSVSPHGRLIDADALMQQIEHDAPLSTVFEKTMRRYLHNAPTIIEAEEEDK